VALAGNWIFASPDAQFGQPEMKLGVFAPAASVLLPWRMPQPMAEDLLFSGRSIGATQAQACGLVTLVAEDPEHAALAWFHEHLQPKSAASLALAVERRPRPAQARTCATAWPRSRRFTSTA
jgi:cyclohexa-1,5-dienecarbonyl-CoA hydratase